MKIIDLRSDTVTKPSKEMLMSCLDACTGDDVYDEDKTVIQLQKRVAHDLSFESALFMPTGTMSNLAAILTHCNRGDEFITGQTYHSYLYEAGGCSALASVQPQPIIVEDDGQISVDNIKKYIKPKKNIHYTNSKLIVLENTVNGKILPMEYLQDVQNLAKSENLLMHLDGSRLYNAVIELGIQPSVISSFFDSVSVCLSKGLGAPAGSVLCGSKSFIKTAKRYRKMLGGGMRQVGILAAFGLYALDNNLERLAEDHQKAQMLAAGLEKLNFEVEKTPTNILIVKVSNPEDLSSFLFSKGINVIPSKDMRLVTHMDVSFDDIQEVLDAFELFVS